MYSLKVHNLWKDKTLPCHFVLSNIQDSLAYHSHNFFEIVLITSGKGILISPVKNKKLKKGDVLVIRPGQIYGYKNTENFNRISVCIKASFFEDFFYSSEICDRLREKFKSYTLKDVQTKVIESVQVTNFEYSKLVDMIMAIQNEIENKNVLYRIQVKSMLAQLVIFLIRVIEKKECFQKKVLIEAESVIKYIEENYCTDLRLDTILKKTGMSESTLERLIKKYTGYSPIVYKNMLRIKASCEELRDTNKPITMIAMDYGFNDSNYFSRMFKNIMGISPSKYRKENAQKI